MASLRPRLFVPAARRCSALPSWRTVPPPPLSGRKEGAHRAGGLRSACHSQQAKGGRRRQVPVGGLNRKWGEIKRRGLVRRWRNDGARRDQPHSPYHKGPLGETATGRQVGGQGYGLVLLLIPTARKALSRGSSGPGAPEHDILTALRGGSVGGGVVIAYPPPRLTSLTCTGEVDAAPRERGSNRERKAVIRPRARLGAPLAARSEPGPGSAFRRGIGGGCISPVAITAFQGDALY